MVSKGQIVGIYPLRRVGVSWVQGLDFFESMFLLEFTFDHIVSFFPPLLYKHTQLLCYIRCIVFIK